MEIVLIYDSTHTNPKPIRVGRARWEKLKKKSNRYRLWQESVVEVQITKKKEVAAEVKTEEEAKKIFPKEYFEKPLATAVNTENTKSITSDIKITIEDEEPIEEKTEKKKKRKSKKKKK